MTFSWCHMASLGHTLLNMSFSKRMGNNIPVDDIIEINSALYNLLVNT